MEDGASGAGCILQLQCHLCRYSFRQDELIVAFFDDGRVTDKIEFQVNRASYDESYRTRLHFCHGCRTARVPCFHEECFRLGAKLEPPLSITQELLDTTLVSFPPLASDECRRVDRAVTIIFRTFFTKHRSMLPLPRELQLMIAELLAGSLARRSAVAALNQSGRPIELADLQISSNIYALYCSFDGIRYVQKLQNSEPNESEKRLRPWQLLYNATGREGEEKNGGLRKVIIVEDHVGIRLVRFVHAQTPNKEPPLIKGAWWSNISVPDGTIALTLVTDGCKLRNLAPVSPSSTLSRTLWATATHPTEVMNLATLRPTAKAPQCRMCYFDCNASGTKGYSVAVDRSGVVVIHTHQHTNTTIYEDSADRILIWIYMPIDHEEYLVEICSAQKFSHTIMFITNQGRSVHFGGFCPALPACTRIYSAPKTATRIFFNTTEQDPARYFAFEKSQRPEQRPWPPSLLPVKEAPYKTPDEILFFSRCQMDGVTEVTLCVGESLPNRTILGMLLQAGKRTACIGQFRFDVPLETLQVDHSSGFYVVTQRRPDGFRYVADVSLDPTAQGFGVQLHHIRLCGTLEWWFTSHRSIIRYYEGTNV